MLSALGLKTFDLALLIFCPLGAVIGSFAQAIMLSINPDRPPRDEGDLREVSKQLERARGAWLTLRLALGAVLGLVIALYFLGALQESLSTFAKIVALSILLGYAAPKIWTAQERLMVDHVEKIVARELRGYKAGGQQDEQSGRGTPGAS